MLRLKKEEICNKKGYKIEKDLINTVSISKTAQEKQGNLQQNYNKRKSPM